MGSVNYGCFGSFQSLENIRGYYSRILCKQDINSSTSLTSNYSLSNIYNEIDR